MMGRVKTWIIVLGWTFSHILGLSGQTNTCFTYSHSVTPSCDNVNNGTITLTIFAGSGSFEIFFNNSKTPTSNRFFAGLAPGTYNFLVRDTKASTCDKNFTISLGMVSAPIVKISLSQQPCVAETVTLSTDLDPNTHTFSWSTGSTASTTTIVATGQTNVSATVTNRNNCRGTGTISISPRPTPSISLSTPAPICSGTSLTLGPKVSGGTSPYAYRWSDNSSGPLLTRTFTISSSVSLTVTDANGCRASQSVGVSVRSSPTPAITGNTSLCSGQSTILTASASGGSIPYRYQWSNGQVSSALNVLPLSSTIYTVTVTDASGCSGTSSIPVAVNATPVVAGPFSTAVCQGGSVLLNPGLSAGSHTFLWSTNSTGSTLSLNPQANTSISLTVTNANKCSSTAVYAIQVLANPAIQLSAGDSLCANKPLTLSPTVSGGKPGYSYLWSDNSTGSTITRSFLVSTTISLSVTDANGCRANTSTAVAVYPNPSVSISGVVDLCPGQSTTLNAIPSGGAAPYTYLWSSGDKTSSAYLTPSGISTYQVTLTDRNQCSGMASISVSPTRKLSLKLPFPRSICLGDSIVLTPETGLFSGELSYRWSNGKLTVTILEKPLVTTQYSLEIKDRLGCIGSAETTITVNSPPTIVIPNPVTGCLQENVNVLPSITGLAPFSYLWSNGNRTQNGLFLADMEKEIGLSVTDGNGCRTATSTRLIVKSKPLIILQTRYTACANVAFHITPSVSSGQAPYRYLWSNGATEAIFADKIQENTMLSLTVTDANGCSDWKSTQAELIRDIPLVVLPDTIQACQGSEVGIKPQIGGNANVKSYIWSDGFSSPERTQKMLSTSLLLSLQVLNVLGCVGMDSVWLVPYRNPSFFLPLQVETCVATPVRIEARSEETSTSFLWSTGQQSRFVDIAPVLDVSVKVVATSVQGCKDSAFTLVKTYSNPMLSIGGKKEHCGKTPATFSARITSGNPPFVVTWGSGERGDLITYPAIDSIQQIGATVLDAKGCRSSATLALSLLKNPDITLAESFSLCENNLQVLNPLVSGGLKPYVYTWSNGEKTPGIKVGPGEYLFQVADGNGCASKKSVRVNPLKLPEVFVTSLRNPSCNTADGQITIDVKGAVPVDVTWSTGAKGLTLRNVWQGKYKAGCVDTNGCLSEITQNLICSCEGKVGSMEKIEAAICRDEIRMIKYDASTEFIGSQNGRWFVLHNSPGLNLGNQVIATDSLPVARFYSTMATGTTYYLSAVIGRRLPNGKPDFGDPCLAVAAGTPLRILPTPDAPIRIAASDSLVCPGTTVTLQTNRQENGFVYRWQTPRGLITTLTPELTLPRFENMDIGGYSVSVESSKCLSTVFGPITINFDAAIREIFTEPDKTVCGRDSVQILANLPTGSSGKWLSGSAAKIGDVQKENTWVRNLVPGSNLFVWAVITRNCVVSDSLRVYYVPKPKLKNDTVNLDDTKNTALFDFLDNDELGGIPPQFLRIRLVSKPTSGNLTVDKSGNFNYARDPNIDSDQTFKFTYEVCNTDTTGRCPDNCATADVVMNVSYNPTTLIYPTIGLRPNFNNPVWKFEAARPMYSARLSIFDRWGRLVHREDYLQLQKGEIVGKWNGLNQQNLKLPAGAYYFSLIGEIENNEEVVQNGILYLMD